MDIEVDSIGIFVFKIDFVIGGWYGILKMKN